MKGICGIDPGLSGGAVLLGDDGRVLRKFVFPTYERHKYGKRKKSLELDLSETAEIFRILAEETKMAFLEYASARPGEGTSSMFKFGTIFGALRAYLVAFRIPHRMVTPATWCKEIHKGLDFNLPAKQRSRIALENIFPTVDFCATERARTPHTGLMDAALIAEWGRRFTAQQKLF